jgi:hypothetical protein
MKIGLFLLYATEKKAIENEIIKAGRCVGALNSGEN